MNIGIVGYGVMGKFVEKAVKARGHEVSVIVDPSAQGADCGLLADISKDKLAATDAFIDFSAPGGVMGNIMAALKFGKPFVMATTGWYDEMEKVETLVRDAGLGFVWGSNFSVGVNLFWKVIEKATEIIGPHQNYDVFTHEFHHKRKKDSPSGTALTTAKKVIKNHPTKTKIVTESLDRTIEADEIHVSSTRGGDVPGTHQVYFDSLFDTIQISHTARTREGFAIGSVIAAEWVKDKKGFYEFADVFSEI